MSERANEMTDEINFAGRVSNLETEQKYIRSDIKTLSDNLNTFITTFQQKKDESSFSRKDIILYIFGAVGFIGGLFTGAMWLINTQVGPMTTRLDVHERNVADRFLTQSNTNNERFTSFSETFRALRLGDTQINAAIGDVKVEQGRINDEVHRLAQEMRDVQALHSEAANATQDAEIHANKERIITLETREEARRLRELGSK